MTPGDLFKAGRLDEAIAKATELVKAAPANLNHRVLLCELLCFAGQIDRVDTHLDYIASVESQFSYAVTVFRQCLRAEATRRQVFAEGRAPEFLQPAGEETKLRLRALLAAREGDAAGAADAVRRADEIRVACAVECDAVPQADVRDMDDAIGANLEVFTAAGDYYWVPFDQVVSLEFLPPVTMRDLLWRRTKLCTKDGTKGEVAVPALYADSHLDSDPAIRLGRSTDWVEINGLTRGRGLRCFGIGEDGRSILEITTLKFAPEPGE